MTGATRAAARAPAAETRAPARSPRGHLEYHLLVLVTLGLVAFGLVMVYSASSARAALAAGDPAYFLKRQAVNALVGLAALVLLSRLDLRVVRRLAGPLLVASVVLLVAVLVVGTSVKGAKRWLPLGPLEFQPSELAKLGLALWLASFLATRPAPRTFGELLRPVGLVAGLVCALVVVEPDLGTALATGIMVAAVLVVAGTPLRLLAGAAAAGTAAVTAAIWLEPYRRERFLAFLDPWNDPDGAGFQSVQAMIAFGSGGVFGVGLGESVQKVNYLPEATTDMIFAIVGEELGLAGATAVIAAFAVFGYAGFDVALRARDPFKKCLAAGLTALVLGQAALNLFAVLGLAPLTGIPLPFVSYGGTSLVVALGSVGLLLNIAVNHAAEPALVSDRGRRNRRPRPARARGGRSAARARPGRRVGGLA